ncbi:MAG TPA: alpha-glucosidase C-terminal domain-containing protein, partial [Stenomitos sp.]
VDRIASRLHEASHLYPLHALLFTVPGVPSLYYGSEWGLLGKKSHQSDAPLRPIFHPRQGAQQGSQPDLPAAIARFARLRHRHRALRHGGYRQLHVSKEQLVFMRELADERLVVAVNSADQPVAVTLPLELGASQLVDVLNEGERFEVKGGQALVTLPPHWARVLKLG